MATKCALSIVMVCREWIVGNDDRSQCIECGSKENQLNYAHLIVTWGVGFGHRADT